MTINNYSITKVNGEDKRLAEWRNEYYRLYSSLHQNILIKSPKKHISKRWYSFIKEWLDNYDK